MAYSVETREFNHGKWIFASTEVLTKAENIENIQGSMWIWPQTYARVYLRKTFSIEEVKKGVAVFKCDNIFDLFINSKPVSLKKKSFQGDITQYLQQGENRINIRAYQTNDDRFFTSAITGKISFEDFSIITDNSFESYMPTTPWENNEPEDWQDGEFRRTETLVCEIHPRLYKHSLYLRKSFDAKKSVKKAELYITTAGEAQIYINGVKADNSLLSQGNLADYKEYRVIDITDKIVNGKNILGFLTGSGWLNSDGESNVYMNKNMVLSELYLTYADGEEEIIPTDNSFKCALSPIIDNDLQFGERYDARQEQENWNKIEFDDSLWDNVMESVNDVEVRPYAKKNYPLVTVFRKIEPIKTLIRDTRVIYDFGENCTGRFSLTLNNTFRGQEIKISFCERLDEYGEFVVGNYAPKYFSEDAVYDSTSLGCMHNFDFYTCKGGKQERYEPCFAFTSFRYLCLEGIKDNNQVESVYMCVYSNALELTGVVDSEYSFINELYSATLRSWRSNTMNGPTKCPTRNKSNSPMDMLLFAPTACYLTDADEFLSRWSHATKKENADVYGAGDEIYILPWTLYRFYRDKGVLQYCYPKILEFARNRVDGAYHNLPREPKSTFNDYHAPNNEKVQSDFFASCFYCYMLKIVSQIAEVLGDYKTSDEFAALIEPCVNEFNKKYYLTEENDYLPRNQAGLIFPLAFNLVPIYRQRLLAQKLNERILKDKGLTTGIVGTRFVLGLLCDYGYSDTAFRLLNKKDFPSWKNMLTNLNTVPETWLGIKDMTKEQSRSMNSFAFGTITGWLFEYLGGIRYRESTPGFSHIVLRPVFIKEIGSFKAQFQSAYGKITTKWKISGNTVIYKFETERNVTLILPNGTVEAYPKGSHTITTMI